MSQPAQPNRLGSRWEQAVIGVPERAMQERRMRQTAYDLWVGVADYFASESSKAYAVRVLCLSPDVIGHYGVFRDGNLKFAMWIPFSEENTAGDCLMVPITIDPSPCSLADSVSFVLKSIELDMIHKATIPGHVSLFFSR